MLPDTSVWVDHLRGREDDELGRLRHEGRIVVCGPVLAEMLKGTPPHRRDALWMSVGTLPWAELGRAAWRMVGEVAADLRTAGISLPLTDVEISVAAVRADAALWTRDLDFERIRSALPALELYRPGSA
ncbi:MAG: PIN domain-containing protein [Actinomycetota bacterium]